MARATHSAVESASGAAALLRTGAVRPLHPRTLAALARRLISDGPRADLIYTLHALEDKDRTALVFGNRSWTWGQLYERILRLANWMIATGVKPGDSVAVVLPNRPEFIEAQAAALRVGATASFLNPRLPAEAVAPLLSRIQPRLVLTHRPEVARGIRALLAGAEWDDAILSARATEPPALPRRRGDGKVVIFTSGTTGRPKGAVRSLTASPSALGLFRVLPLRRDDVHLTVCPMYHATGSGFTTLAHALGNTVVLLEKFSPAGFCEAVRGRRVTTTAVVPTMLHELCADPSTRHEDLRSLRAVICTGAPLREEVRARARELLGNVIYDLYGATEMGFVSVAAPRDQRRRPGSVGRLVPGVRIKILDPSGREVARGERGEIWVDTGVAMDGYHDDPELTRERIREGFVSVGDIGYLDEQGYLFVVDRADDMIISGGVNVYPAEAEIALSSHPGVAEVAVLGVDDDKWGQRVVAAVVPREPVDADELLHWCRQRVASASAPKEIRFLESLPRNDIGKVDKRLVAESWPLD
jgi:fatty-acyl-CoA synthase